MNTYGTRFRVTTYGESHGSAVGAVIDGCPSGIVIDQEAIRTALSRRRHGAKRQEEDVVEWFSGLKDNFTLGTPIAFAIHNNDARPEDYAHLEHLFRPGHADYTYYQKYGLRDHRGGGRASARETVARVVAGCIAQQLMPEVSLSSAVSVPASEPAPHTSQPLQADTYGGIVTCRITGVPAGIGDPVFGKLNAQLAAAVMSIPSAIGFEMGAGFAAAGMMGSEYIDRWNSQPQADASDTTALTQTNHCGGVQGGISNGMPIEFRVAFHPVPTLPQPVECLGEDGQLETLAVAGRHDSCHVHRAAVVVEAMAALCLINYLL